jgi:hypothetical protein
MRGISLIKVKLIRLSILLLRVVAVVALAQAVEVGQAATDHLSLEKLQVLIQQVSRLFL